MAVPKRRTSHSKQGHRRSHHAITPPQIQFCKKCGESVLPHRVCSNCGYYQNKEVVVKTQEDQEGK
jgi:large subunit ribosomal protein L32